MRDRLLDLRENLLRGGLSPRHVERYLRELSEHRADIAEHLRDNGLSAAEAYRQADDRLGSDGAILLPMLANSRFRSRAARWPAMFYVGLPLLAQVALVLAGTLALLCAAGTDLRPIIADLGTGVALLLLASPVVIAWLSFLAARRRRASFRWPLVGALAGCLLAATLQIGITPPTSDMAGEIGLAVGSPPLLMLLALSLVSLLPLFLQPRLE